MPACILAFFPGGTQYWPLAAAQRFALFAAALNSRVDPRLE